MHPMIIVAIPLVLVVVGMVLNSIGLGFNQPPSSSEQDPAKRAAAEREDYRGFFVLLRRQAVKRQTRVGQYAWLYLYTVNKTTVATQIARAPLPGSEGSPWLGNLIASVGAPRARMTVRYVDWNH